MTGSLSFCRQVFYRPRFCWPRFAALLVLLVSFFFANANPAHLFAAEATTENGQTGSPVFRRLFVPADAPETWPVGSERFLPIPRDKFRQLLEQNETKTRGSRPSPLHISKAVYRAELMPGNVLRGTAEWSVELPGAQAWLLPLAPSGFVIQSAAWQRAPTQQAAVGLWGSSEDALELAVLVEQSDVLVMKWQLAARKSDSAVAVYDLRKPTVIPQTLELDLPANHRATLSNAQLLRTDTGSLGESHWVFQLAPRENHRLRVYRQAPTEDSQVLPLVSQATSYQLEPSGLNVLTQLRLDARESQITELKAALSSELRVIGVDIDQQPVEWQMVDTAGYGAGESQLVISRPESRQPQLVEIRCVARVSPVGRWELPKLRFDKVAWTEGTTSLLVSPDFELRRLTPRQASLQHIVGIADGGREGEVYRLQEWSREAGLEIEVGRLAPRLASQTLTTIELGRDEAQASVVAEFTNSGGNVYQILAAIAPGWAIDSVATVPASTLNEWHVEHEGNSTTLSIQLNQPLSEQQSLRIGIEARETTGKPVLPSTVGQLKPLKFLEAESSREWLLLRTRQSKQWALDERLDKALCVRDDLPPEFRSLTTEALAGTLLNVSLLEAADVLEFRQQPAAYDVELRVEAEVLADSFRQQYQIDCQVRSGAVSEIVVEVDAPLPQTVEWSLAKLPGARQQGLVTMERLDVTGSDRTTTYRLHFSTALTDDFRLQASFSQPAEPVERCNLLRLPRRSDGVALDWSGQVLLRGSLTGLQVLDQGWTPTVFTTSKTTDEQMPVLGTYRLGPAEFHRSRMTAGLRLQRQDPTAQSAQQVAVPQLLAWLAEYHTLQAADGAALHTAHFWLENLGADEAKIVLPTGAELQEAWLDDQQFELKQLASEGNAYQFRLGSEQHWPYLALKYSTQESPLGGSATLQPAVPKCSFPVNRARWTLWAPEQYEVDTTQENYSLYRVHWWRRLFGPLARSRGETVFNPLRRTSWKSLGPAPLDEQPAGLAANRQESRQTANLVSSIDDARWHRAAPVKNPQWNSPLATTFSDLGRRAQTVEFTEGLPTLVVRRAYVERALWYALLLLTVVLGVWQLAHFPNATILAGALAGAACLIVPAQWLTFTQPVFLGLIAAAIARVAMKSCQCSEDRASSLQTAAQVAVLLMLSCLPFDSAQAQAADVAKSEQNIPRVLVPIDSQGSPEGEEVYLPEKFFKKLQGSPRRAANDGPEVVLLAASYSGSLPNEKVETASAGDPILTEPWTLRWKIESFVPQARLFLPLQRDEAQWGTGLHRLDGVPVKLDWHPGGQGCWVTLPETGIHRLHVFAQPCYSTDGKMGELRLHVPPLPGATLDLVLSPNVDEVQVAGAVRISTRSPLEPWHGLLGGRDVLELDWTSKGAKGNAASWERIEQSAWLQVEPATTRLEVRLAVTGYQADSLLIDLDVSPQLKLEPLGEGSPLAEVLGPSASQPTRVQLKLRSGLPADFVLPLRFELQRAVSVGRIFFPRVRLRESLPAKNLFAVSVSAGLSYDEQVSNDLRSIEPTEFSRSWSSFAEEPLYAYALGPEDPEWSLRVWPDPQSLSVQQSLQVYCSPNAARVDFEAAITELTGSWLSHRLEVPESLQIDSITVADSLLGTIESNQVPVRWSRVSATEAVVFLGRPLQHAHRLRLQGHVNVIDENEIELPQVRLLDDKRSEVHLDLFRTEEVQVSWVDSQKAPQEIAGQRMARSSAEIRVGHFTWRSTQASQLSKLRLESNQQKFETVSVTTVHKTPDGWSARLNSLISVREGAVSRLSLTVPDSIRMPFDLQPELVGVIDEVLETSGGKEITVLLAEPAAAGEQVEIQLGGSLSLPADQRLVIPSLAWSGAAQRDRYVLLPTLIDGQSLQWQTSGLRRQSLPPLLSVYASESHAPYRLEQSQFEAKERTNRGTLTRAKVRYANVSGIIDGKGGFLATAEVVLQPGRATSCAIMLPADSQLRQLIVGGQPVRRELRKVGCWKVPVGPPFMPQRIVVSYHTQLGPIGKRVQLAAPKVLLGDQVLPAPETWWRLQATQGLQLSKPKKGHLSSEMQFAKNSFQQPQSVLEDALTQALDLPREEGLAWAKNWHAVLRQTHRDWLVYNLQEAPLDLSSTNEMQLPFSETFARAFVTEQTSASELSYPPRLPVVSKASLKPKEHFWVGDSQGQIELKISQGSSQNRWQWFAALALVCGALAGVQQLRRNHDWHYDLCHWPHALALTGGVVWWLLLRPSALGIFVIALAIISLSLKRWQWYRRQRSLKPNSQLVIPTS